MIDRRKAKRIGFIDGRGVYIWHGEIGIEEDFKYLREPTPEEKAKADEMAEAKAREELEAVNAQR